ncbi:MAG TPA: ATP-binding protein, partial [Gemmatimonadales bacterium]|nr:ATP-binding protein [Gemmatimonadales bacterium]
AGAGLPTCETDASRVEQILVNLLGNAIQHTPKDSTVRVELAVRNGSITYTVRDEGPGIPATEVERIFDVYATNKEGDLRGTGLGLPLSRRLARLLGGDLDALPRPGEGGEFVLRLPATEES